VAELCRILQVVVHDSTGARVACGVLSGDLAPKPGMVTYLLLIFAAGMVVVVTANNNNTHFTLDI
jgi:hypothetical protein